ncbi:hypothetical protein GCM10017710_23840 [Arthrobacter ramosus]
MSSCLEIEDALQVIDRYGFQMRDVGLLASALARPATTVMGTEAYPQLALKAAALLESVARNSRWTVGGGVRSRTRHLFGSSVAGIKLRTTPATPALIPACSGVNRDRTAFRNFTNSALRPMQSVPGCAGFPLSIGKVGRSVLGKPGSGTAADMTPLAA